MFGESTFFCVGGLGVFIIVVVPLLLLPTTVFAQASPGSWLPDLRKVPDDVYPESGFRLPLPKREDFDEEGKRIFDQRINTGARALGGTRGPSWIRLHSPQLAEHVKAVSHYLQSSTSFSGRIRELAILVSAREMDSQFEWTAHEPEALKAGLSQEIIDVVKFRNKIVAIPETEAIVIQFGRELFGSKKVAPDTFARALKIFGAKELVELVSLMTYFQGMASLLAAFDMQLDPDFAPLLPLP
jgi:4-carboxymuconolactone decarboxylase